MDLLSLDLNLKKNGSFVLEDLVQGKIEISNSTIEDFVLLRADNTPTYQLSASVDDYLNEYYSCN